MEIKIGRRGFVKSALAFLGAVAVRLPYAGSALGGLKPRPRLASLTVDSLSITPGSEWPVDGNNGVLCARDEVTFDADVKDRIIFIEPESLPTSNTEGTWSGTPQVQTDFSP